MTTRSQTERIFRVTLRVAIATSLSALVATLADCSRESEPQSSTTSLEGSSVPTLGRVSLPTWGDAPFTIRDPRTAMTLRSRLRESQHAAREDVRGEARYRNAVAGGGDISFRETANGAEDFITLPSPDLKSLSYELTLDAHVAGLRLVSNSLELLDANGFPRLRIQTPYLRDSSKKRLSIALSIEGCAVSTSSAPPFHKSVMPPGSRNCIARLSWDPKEAHYPVVVDPGWMTTSTMNTPRYEQVAWVLPSGDLMVAGGLTGDPLTSEGTTDTTEIYSGGVWAAGTPMLVPRVLAAWATLPSGDLLVTGGLTQDETGQTILGSSEIYSPTASTWTASGSLVKPRSGHTATPVGDGTILIAGGYDNSGNHFSDAEIYSAGVFTLSGEINTSRFYHAAVQLSGNRVLLGGGTDPFSGATGTLELYTAGSGWSAASALASMTTPRTLMTGTLLANGDVAFIGGYNSTDLTLGSAEIYHPPTNTWSTASGTMIHPRYDAAATLLTDGRVLVVGGEDTGGDFRDAEIFDVSTGNFSDFCGMSDFRAFGHTVTLMNSGAALVIGGYDYRPSRILGSVDLFDLTVDASIDASICEHPIVVIPDSGSPIDASTDATAVFTDAASSSEPDASNMDAATNPKPPHDSGATVQTGPVEAGGGCDISSSARNRSSGENSLFFSCFGIFFVLLRSRRWQDSARPSRPFS